MSHTAIPDDELKFFKAIPGVKVVFDVGARADTDYIRLKPSIEFHAFEPNPEFFGELVTNVGTRDKTYLNNFGLGDVEGTFGYNFGRQAFVNGEEPDLPTDTTFQIKTLDSYVAERNVTEIDFLKIDTEGFDLKVLQGGLNTIDKCRFIQYEHWNDTHSYHELLEERFYMMYIGGRNVLCIRKDQIV
jgi:FkbM family methyltransferase